jgi:hypothetical protein
VAKTLIADDDGAIRSLKGAGATFGAWAVTEVALQTGLQRSRR